MNIDPKYLAGAAILGGGALYFYMGRNAVAELDYGEKNRADWATYDANMTANLENQRDKLMEEIANADEHSKPRLLEKLNVLNQATYDHERYSTKIEGLLATGNFEDKSLWTPSKEDTFAAQSKVYDQFNVLKATPQYENLQKNIELTKSVDPFLSAQQGAVSQRYGRAQTDLTMINNTTYADPREQEQARQKAQRELDKVQKYQQDVDAMNAEYNAAVTNGTTLPGWAQYQRNQV